METIPMAASDRRETDDETSRDAVFAVSSSVGNVLRERGRVVLAVSGGRDSMVLLDAAAEAAPSAIVAVATFDHGTGASATAAVDLVNRRCDDLGLHCASGVAAAFAGSKASEAAWRDARWDFLRHVAGEHRAAIATAHTLDDHIETVLLRVLRGAGARGLAGLLARSSVARPFVDVPRSSVVTYARERGLSWVEDPTNTSPKWLRNRVRTDLLPAITRVHPSFAAELLELARRAAALRDGIEDFVARHVDTIYDGEVLHVARASILHYDAQALEVLWPVVAALAGLALDRRGTRRLAEFTISGSPGASVQLAGGHEVVRHRDEFLLRPLSSRREVAMGDEGRVLADGLVVGRYRFRSTELATNNGLWSATLPASKTLIARAWRAGDRMLPQGAWKPRRVKGLLRDAGIDGLSRRDWPVVLADGEIIWIPGVRLARTDSVANTPARGRVRRIVCERSE